MENIIFLTCLLIGIHIICPMFIGLFFSKEITLDYLFSSRDIKIKAPLFYERAKRSFLNFFETFPIFIILVLVSMIKNVDNFDLSLIWLILRYLYIPVYIFGIKYLRTVIWGLSFITLILMAIKFL